MSLSDDSDEIMFSFDDVQGSTGHNLFCMSISGIHKAVYEGDLYKVKRWIESGESVNKKETHYNFSPLHIAVVCYQIEMLDYLLAREGVDMNARCSKGRTPLYFAAASDCIELVEKLVQAGSDVNIADNDGDTALHMSVYCPQVCRYLVQHGARICTNGSRGMTLNVAVVSDCLEVVHMLLYYDVDVNGPDLVSDLDPDVGGPTPFMEALMFGNEEAQKILFEYVDDFNRFYSQGLCFGYTLCFALHTNSPFIKDMIERGADVNYGDDPENDDDYSAFSACLRVPVDVSIFKMIWERLEYNAVKNTIDLLHLFSKPKVVPEFLQIIIESDNFETAVECFSKGETYCLFVNKFVENAFELEQLSALTCRLLEHGFRASSYDIHAIFSNYGYCELFKILLYMDNDFTCGWLPHMAVSRLIFDIDYDLGSIAKEVNDIPKEIVLQFLEYSISPRLVDALILQYSDDNSMSVILSNLPKVPLLMELARNAARQQIWQAFNVTGNCQFYTIVDHLCITNVYKDVLSFRRKMYSVQKHTSN